MIAFARNKGSDRILTVIKDVYKRQVLALEAGLLMLPLMVGLYYRERCVLSLLATIVLLLAAGIPLLLSLIHI